MFWGKGPDKSPPAKETPAVTKNAAKDDKNAAEFDPEKLPERQKLPKSLQKIVDKEDKEDNFYNELVSG